MSGLFISIEGGDGAGKSTQARLLVERLGSLGRECVLTREPGGTPAGDAIRALVLDPAYTMSSRTELFLYEASRAELTSSVILPAIDRGKVVVCDRFFDSSTAYQAYGRGLDVEEVRALNLAATGHVRPDITVLLILDLARAIDRATSCGADRLEMESHDFHARVIDGFLAIASAEPDRFVVIDATGTPEEVAARVWHAVTEHHAFLRAIQDSE